MTSDLGRNLSEILCLPDWVFLWPAWRYLFRGLDSIPSKSIQCESFAFEPDGSLAMHEKPAPATASALPDQSAQPPRIDSAELLRGQNTVEIDHGGQRYLLRVTRENKLILTK